MTDINLLGSQAVAALNAGKPVEAREKFQAIIDAGSADETVWLGLALATLAQGDFQATVDAADEVLSKNAQNIRALILKGDGLWQLGDRRGASKFYTLVGAMVPDTAELPQQVAREISRVNALNEEHKTALSTHLDRSINDVDPSYVSDRFSQALDLLKEKKERFEQEPRAFYFPELPTVQFYNPDDLSWTQSLTSKIEAIVEEFESALPKLTGFRPYIHADGNLPINPDHPLLDNSDWSAAFLAQSGSRDDALCALFPETMKALEAAPLERIPGRGPSILISRLLPGARIDAHRGFLNTRLTCHIPLIIPENCGIRVGNETRSWTSGELLIFNDSIDHEAWNNSAEERYVLIFQVWRPELSEQECELVSKLLQGIDSYSA